MGYQVLSEEDWAELFRFPHESSEGVSGEGPACSPDTIEKVLANRKKYSVTAVKRDMKDPKRLKERLEDGKLMICKREKSNHNGDCFMIGILSPLMAAIDVQEWRLAEGFLKSQKEPVSAEDVKWVYCETGKVSPSVACSAKVTEQRLTEVLLSEMPQTLRLQLFRRAMEDAADTIVSEISGHWLEEDAGARENLMETLWQLYGKEEALPVGLAAPGVAAKLFQLAVFYMKEAKIRARIRRILKKLYELRPWSADMMWPIMLSWKETAEKNAGDVFLKLWREVTGKEMIFDYKQKKTLGLSAENIAMITRFSDGMKHERGSSCLCGWGLLQLGNEDLFLEALQKDIITKDAVPDLVNMARKEKRLQLIPALVLKQSGFWPQS